MKKLVLAIIVLSLVAPLCAQGRSVDVHGVFAWVDPSGNDVTIDTTGGDYELGGFDSDTGYGGGINLFITRRLSAEISVYEVKPEGRVNFGSSTAVGQLDMIPITGVLQYHFNPEGKFDFYVGGGVAYVLFDEFKSDELGDLGIGDINFREDYGVAWNAGVSFALAGGIAVLADAKYVPTDNQVTTSVGDTDIEISPLILSAGVQIRF